MTSGGWQGIDPSTWSGLTTQGMTALLRNSIQELASEASKTIPNGGNVPVKTGNLARSVVIDTKPPKVDDDGVIHKAAPDFSLGVAEIKPGDTVYIGWQARYSRRQNYGFVGDDSLGRTYNQAGYGFAEATAAQWPAIVIRQAAKMGAR